jgi:phosphocarrier protein HPr
VTPPGATGGPLRRTAAIVNQRGLHARASAKFVKCAAQFDAEVRVSRDGQTVDAQSIMGLMMLAAGLGSEVEIEAEGQEAEAALDALCALIAARFDEDA